MRASTSAIPAAVRTKASHAGNCRPIGAGAVAAIRGGGDAGGGGIGTTLSTAAAGSATGRGAGGGGAAGASKTVEAVVFSGAVAVSGEHRGHSLYEGGTSAPHFGQIQLNMIFFID